MALKLNDDGELEVVDELDFIPKTNNAIASIQDLSATVLDRLAYEQSRHEYKQRLARNGMCPHDSKPCWRYKVCIMSKAEACEFYNVTKNSGSGKAVVCTTCRNAPKEGCIDNCVLFRCMVAGNNRKCSR
jgi:hypothetical protein